jgi:hypothetical protein
LVQQLIYYLMFLFLFVPLPASLAIAPACYFDSVDSEATLLEYHASPKDVLSDYDTVFWGEVLVALRPCSLGHCAGLKVLNSVKGEAKPMQLIILDSEQTCTVTRFKVKHSKWLVFGNKQNTKGGIHFIAVHANNPTGLAKRLPDFSRLEHQYHGMRRQLNHAIDHRL